MTLWLQILREPFFTNASFTNAHNRVDAAREEGEASSL
jgi:hypothetical protein